MGRDPEGTAKRSPIGDRYHQHTARVCATDTSRRHLNAGVPEKLAEGRVYIDGVTLQEFDGVAGLENRRVEPEPAAVEEVVTVGEAQVDGDRSGVGGEAGDLMGRQLGDAECLGEVVAGAAGYDGQRAPAWAFSDRLSDMAAGAVASNRDNELRAFLNCAFG